MRSSSSEPDAPLRVDTYTHGHHPSVVGQHARRTAEDCAGFARDVVAPSSQVLDVGCGPASITVGLARWAHEGSVTGVEPGDDILATARQAAAEAGVGNVTFRQASVYELPFDDGSFDVAYAHQVLQHLSDPVSALVEMARVTRAGGYVAVRDADYATMRSYPTTDGIERWRELYFEVARRNEGEPEAGRHLLAWCAEAGLADVTMSASVWLFATPAERENWGHSWSERCVSSSFATQAVEYGLSSTDELERLAAAWRAWADEPSGYFHFIHGEALARVG